MANPTRVSLFLSPLILCSLLAAQTPAKKPEPSALNRGAAQASTGGDTGAPLPNAKSKKKKLLRPGVEWEPAPAPIKW